MAGLKVEDLARLSGLAGAFATDTYGELTAVGAPRLIQNGRAAEYPLMCFTHLGYLDVGLLSFDAAGNVLAAPSREEVARTADMLVRRLEGGELDPADTALNVQTSAI